MAAAAIGSTRTFVDIISGVARQAGLGQRFPSLSGVARKASGPHMGARQCKTGPAVIEWLDRLPPGYRMAGLTDFTQLPLVRVLRRMAGGASGDRALVILPPMAPGTRNLRVTAFERIIGIGMIETCG